jgi:hypothetical protein
MENWPEQIGDLTITDAILDRLIHCAHKINLSMKGDSLRKKCRLDLKYQLCERTKKPASLRSDQGWRNQSEHPDDLDRNWVADSFGIEWRNHRNTHLRQVAVTIDDERTVEA